MRIIGIIVIVPDGSERPAFFLAITTVTKTWEQRKTVPATDIFDVRLLSRIGVS